MISFDLACPKLKFEPVDIEKIAKIVNFIRNLEGCCPQDPFERKTEFRSCM